MSERKIIFCSRCSMEGKHAAYNICTRCYNKDSYKKNRDNWIGTRKLYNINNRQKIREYQKLYYSMPDKVPNELKRKREYYWKNKEKMNNYGKIWNRTEHGKKIKIESSHKRRAKLNQVIHAFTYDEWLQKIYETGGVCQACKEYVGEDKITMDHIVPISKAPIGFVYTLNDIQPLCKICNCKKGVKLEKVIIT